jgi:alpha/beta superfamily hydrolase
MAEPAYSFTIPSLADDTPLDCRIYHPEDFEAVLANAAENGHATRGAIVAHPYPVLGGSYDDAVVLAVVRCLLKEGFVVGTFNFR